MLVDGGTFTREQPQGVVNGRLANRSSDSGRTRESRGQYSTTASKKTRRLRAIEPLRFEHRRICQRKWHVTNNLVVDCSRWLSLFCCLRTENELPCWTRSL